VRVLHQKLANDHDASDAFESSLERQLIGEYLLSKGYRKSDLRNLPEEQRSVLMTEAIVYAALRLANIEAKSKFRQKIRFP
jgi:hypothetical protein